MNEVCLRYSACKPAEIPSAWYEAKNNCFIMKKHLLREHFVKEYNI